jgi:AbrB family looped-hinge helix DNA binding protein
MIISINSRGTLTLPAEFRKKLALKEGDHLEITIDKGKIVITPVAIVPKIFILSEKGRNKEKEADKEIKAGKIKSFFSAEALIKDLND